MNVALGVPRLKEIINDLAPKMISRLQFGLLSPAEMQRL
jgi:hypothetical protein